MRVYAARWIIPVATPSFEHGVVAVADGRIQYVGPRNGAPEGELVELGEAVILPGLVNAHTHLELTVMRGFLEEMEFRPWIVRLTKARLAVLSREHLLASAQAGIAEGLLAGITSYGDTCESGVVLQAMSEMGVRGVMYQEVFGPDPAQCAESLAGLREKVDALRPLASSRVALGVSPHAPYSVSDALFAATTRYARAEALPMAVHLAESDAESALVCRGIGPFADGLRARSISVAPRAGSSVALLDALGVLDARPLLIHCVTVSDNDLGTIARHSCAIAHCPASNAKLGHGIAPLGRMLTHGLRVGLGSDSVASNNRMDMLDEARLAVLLQRASERRHDVLPAAEAIQLATRGGAEALGLGSV
ncbi:MAG: amidohydrolase family protein, partial [Gemmatimonadaceae bacterium]